MVEKIKYIVNLIIVALLLASVAISRDGRIAGRDIVSSVESQEQSSGEVKNEEWLSDGVQVINSLPLAQDIVGFGGRVPIKLYVKDGAVERVELQEHSETPSFMDRVVSSGLLERWTGLSLAEAADKEVDNISGATYTTVAIAENVRRAAEWGANLERKAKNPFSGMGLKGLVGLLVVASGVALTFVKSRNKHLVTLQLILNVVVLGFWCGSFLSLSTLTAWMSSGVNFSLSLVTFALFCAALIVPLFSKKGSYCHLHCPMGAAQELIGRVPITKAKLSPRASRRLNSLRYYILCALLFMMWLGVGFDIMNYEIFSAFIFESASEVVLVLAAIFLTLSLFITRPYCRFVCPTGALITMSQKVK